LGPYSTVVWISDDYGQQLAGGVVAELREYLNKGGRLLLAGWKPSANITNYTGDSAIYTAGNFIYDYFKVSRMKRSQGVDSLVVVKGLLSYPNVAVDSAKVPLASWKGAMLYIDALEALVSGEGIYQMDMRNNGSVFEGLNCGVRYLGSDYKTAIFGFPLYFMNKEQARSAINKVLADFGELSGAEGKPESRDVISEVSLYQNAPNPFNGQTNISYQLPKSGQVKLNIYNIAGQLVKTLVNGEQSAGKYQTGWNRRDNHNKQVSAGVYIYQLSIGDKTQSRKMIVLK
jgi:hypothetical protein